MFRLSSVSQLKDFLLDITMLSIPFMSEYLGLCTQLWQCSEAVKNSPLKVRCTLLEKEASCTVEWYSQTPHNYIKFRRVLNNMGTSRIIQFQDAIGILDTNRDSTRIQQYHEVYQRWSTMITFIACDFRKLSLFATACLLFNLLRVYINFNFNTTVIRIIVIMIIYYYYLFFKRGEHHQLCR